MKYADIEFPFDEAENYLQSANKEKMNKFFLTFRKRRLYKRI